MVNKTTVYKYRSRCETTTVRTVPWTTVAMPLKGVNGRLYDWCVVCRTSIPGKHKTLRIHLNRAHSLEFLPGCPVCFYYRSRWADVKKHCQRQHDVDIDLLLDDQGVAWGLTRLDDSKVKPTYSSLREEDICKYPLKGETLTQRQVIIVGAAQFAEPTVQPRTRSRESERAKTTGRSSKRLASSSPARDNGRRPSSRSGKTSAEVGKREPAHPSGKAAASGAKSTAPVRVKERGTVKSGADQGNGVPQTPQKQQSSGVVQTPDLREWRSAVYSSTPASGRQLRSSTPQDLDASQITLPPTPCKSGAETSFGSRTTPRRSARRSLDQVVQELSSSVGTMETVSELGIPSPAPLSIPVLEPEEVRELSGISGATAATAATAASSSSSRTSSSGGTTSDSQDLYELVDPSTLPAGTVVRPVPVCTATQTELHLDPDDVVLVIPRGGGRLHLQ